MSSLVFGNKKWIFIKLYISYCYIVIYLFTLRIMVKIYV